MDNLDKKIHSILSEELEMSNSYINMLNNTIDNLPDKNEKRKSFKFLKLALATTCCLTLIISGTAFALNKNNIINHAKNFFLVNKGIDTAIDNGYIEKADINYINSNKTKVSIENILMDDFNLSFSLLINIDKNIDTSKIARIRIPNMIITDEENRILYCDDKTTFDNYCKEKSLNYTFGETSDNYINSGSNWYIKNKSADSKTFELVYNLSANKYPKSKKLFVNFTQINMTEKEISENEEIALSGNWNIKYNLPKKFYNRTAIVYSVKSCSNPDFKITEACLYNTGFRFDFETKLKEWYPENADKKERDKAFEKHDEWYLSELNKNELNSGYINGYIRDEYLEAKDGKKYYPLASSTEDQFTSYQVTGDFRHMQTFSLTKYNSNADTLKIHFSLHLPYLDEPEDVIIELERNH
ncbi:MAG: DUF4179 domain-containing protein [Clostridia bacterium]|nr:DUF4179 domain-containing protein [Clostridia bacterium]